MKQKISSIFKRYFVDAMSYMALGLFSSLIIGLIISQISKIPYLSFLAPFAAIVSASSPVVGGAIGAAIAYGLKASPLTVFSSVATGAFGYSVGGPVGAYIAATAGAEFGRLVAGKTKVDIIVTPITTIITGSIVGDVFGSPIQALMTGLGAIVNVSTELSPIPMGIAVSVIVGLALTAPISSAALCIVLGLDGLAAGAAVAGCSAQMIGFAVASFRDNDIGGFISQALGTSMLQFSNIMKNPAIWIAPTLASAFTGPISTAVFGMTNIPLGAGMGTSGLVGQFGAFTAMTDRPFFIALLQVVFLHFILPALLTFLFDAVLRKCGWVKDGQMSLTIG